MRRDLIIYLPVIHRGYLDFLQQKKLEIETVYILGDDFLSGLKSYKPTIASLQSKEAQEILTSLGFADVMVVGDSELSSLKSRPIMLVADDVSKELAEKYFKNSDIDWQSVFLYWDRSSIFVTEPVNTRVSTDEFDQIIMGHAYKVAEQSSDWWRRVGAVLVQNDKEVLLTYNKAIPDDHTPYQVGAVRDYLEPGERPDLSSTIHAEQWIVAQAAKQGLKLEGTSLYVTHFPCSVCAKIIAYSGVAKCFFGEGYSNLSGQDILQKSNVELIVVKPKS